MKQVSIDKLSHARDRRPPARQSQARRRGALERLLVVEDCPELRGALLATLATTASEVRGAAGALEASALMKGWHPELVLLDFGLPDGEAFDVLELVAAARSMPLVVAVRGAGARASFQLAQLGVRAFVPEPLTAENLERALAAALDEGPDLTPLLRASVGHKSVHQVEEQVRATMVAEALARSRGNLSYAARMLAISRQLLQHILKRD